MQVSRDGIELITLFEGFSPISYVCPGGYRTIGFGHVIQRDEVFDGHLTEDDATEILRIDLFDASQAVNRLITWPLTQNQFDALASFTFNLGAGALQRSTLRRVVNRGDHNEVPAQLLRWVWAGGRRLRGLVRRRAAEAAMYR